MSITFFCPRWIITLKEETKKKQMNKPTLALWNKNLVARLERTNKSNVKKEKKMRV